MYRLPLPLPGEQDNFMEACKENKQTKPIVDWTVCAEEGNGVRACPHQVFERCMYDLRK